MKRGFGVCGFPCCALLEREEEAEDEDEDEGGEEEEEEGELVQLCCHGNCACIETTEKYK